MKCTSSTTPSAANTKRLARRRRFLNMVFSKSDTVSLKQIGKFQGPFVEGARLRLTTLDTRLLTAFAAWQSRPGVRGPPPLSHPVRRRALAVLRRTEADPNNSCCLNDGDRRLSALPSSTTFPCKRPPVCSAKVRFLLSQIRPKGQVRSRGDVGHASDANGSSWEVCACHSLHRAVIIGRLYSSMETDYRV